MKCDEAKELIFIGENLPVELYKHVVRCPECRELLESMNKMASELKGTSSIFKEEAFPSDLHSKIMNGVKAQKNKSIRFSFYKVAAAACLIASVLFAVSIGHDSGHNHVEYTSSSNPTPLEFYSAVTVHDLFEKLDSGIKAKEIETEAFYKKELSYIKSDLKDISEAFVALL